MRRYETIFIVNPDIPEDARTQIFDRTTKIIEDFGGVVAEFDDWGVKKLAYEIRKKARGYYVRLDYCGDGAMVNEMERSFKIDDRVLKFMTILLDKYAEPEAVKAEIAAAKEAKAKAAAEAENAPAEDETETEEMAEEDE